MKSQLKLPLWIEILFPAKTITQKSNVILSGLREHLPELYEHIMKAHK
jgi:hypothetical protein